MIYSGLLSVFVRCVIVVLIVMMLLRCLISVVVLVKLFSWLLR